MNFSQKNEHTCRITDVFKKTDKLSVILNNTSMDSVREFTRPKKDGLIKVILNLKYLIGFFNYTYFKTKSLSGIFNLMYDGVWMSSADLQDAFFTVPVHHSHQKILNINGLENFSNLYVCLSNL